MKFLFFWGHQPSRSGGIGPGSLSQWWPTTFTVEGDTYASAEHFMMVAKARLFGDELTAQRILAAPHPGTAKALGRQVVGFDEQTWVAHRYDIVIQANMAKFEQDPGLRDYLRTTAGRVLVEASPLDRIWGIGLAADDERASRPSQWRGLNLLGFALMEVRAALAR
ncbi:NADAR family protein [Streptomyces gobiensis]|uniref:NADAR family protein n=1 Tax=Streptomyces gobiensis TaxID=2875706 RepID=UPI0030CE4A72